MGKFHLDFLNGMGYGITRPIVIIDFPKITKVNLSKFYTFFKKYKEFIDFEKVKIYNLYELILLVVKLQYAIARIPCFNEFVSLKKDRRYIFDYYNEVSFQKALNYSLWLIRNLNQSEQAIDNKLDQNIKLLKSFAPIGLNNYRMLQAAYTNKIPFWNLTKNTYVLGYGKNSIHLESTVTDNTSPIFLQIARNKVATKQFLINCGLPTASFVIVKSIEELKKEAMKLGYPMVVKPVDTDGGKGVYSGIQNEKSLLWAYNEAIKISKNIMLEKHIDGKDYRINIFNGHILNITNRIPGGVIGDGKHTILQLIDIVNESKENVKISHSLGKKSLDYNEEAKSLLDDMQLDENHIPEKEKFIPLRRKANISTGGTKIPIETVSVHKDNIVLIQSIEKLFQLDFIGIDIIFPDISKSWQKTGGGILEVNGQPQIPEIGWNQIFKLYKNEIVKNSGKLDSFIIICDDTSLEKEICDLILNELDNRQLGFVCEGGVFINGAKVKNTSSYSKDAKFLYSSKEIGKLILIYSYEEILRFGLSIDGIQAILLLKTDNKQQYVDTLELIENCSESIYELENSLKGIKEIIE